MAVSVGSGDDILRAEIGLLRAMQFNPELGVAYGADSHAMPLDPREGASRNSRPPMDTHGMVTGLTEDHTDLLASCRQSSTGGS